MIPALLLALAVAAPGSHAGTCRPTAPDALGPFYVANAPRRSRIGTGHVLTGAVRSSRDCRTLARARLEFWQVGPNGRYDAAHRATLFSTRAGTYRFESNFPPPYSGRPSHIHIRVSARGHETLVTQYYPRRGQGRGTFDLVLRPREAR